MAGGERIGTTPGGKAGGSRFVRGEAGGRFGAGQTSSGRGVAQDKRTRAKNTAPKGMRDRGD